MPSPLFRIFTVLLLAAVIAPNAILFAQQPADATHFRSLFQQGQILLVRTSRETNTTSAQLLTAQQKTEFEAKRKEIEQHNQGIERQLADLRSRLSADQPIETARLLRKEFELQDEIQVIPYRGAAATWYSVEFAGVDYLRLSRQQGDDSYVRFLPHRSIDNCYQSENLWSRPSSRSRRREDERSMRLLVRTMHPQIVGDSLAAAFSEIEEQRTLRNDLIIEIPADHSKCLRHVASRLDEILAPATD